MKKNERLFELIGEIDLKYVVEAYPKKRLVRPLLLTAGGVCAAAAVAILLFRGGGVISDNVEVDAGNPAETSISAVSDTEITYLLEVDEVDEVGEADEAGAIERPVSDDSENEGNIEIIAEDDIYPFKYDGREPQVLRLNTDAYMGAMGAMSYTETIPESGNPWSEELGLTELPVFIGNKRYSMFKPEPVAEKAQKILARFTDDMQTVSYELTTHPEYFDPEDRDWVLERTTTLTAEAGGIKLYAHGSGNGGQITIYLPKEWEPFTLQEIAERLGYKNPTKDPHEDYGYTIVYESSDDPLTDVLNYNFRNFDYRVIEGSVNNLFITDTLDTLECVGFYPIMSVEEMKAELQKGNYSAMYDDLLKDADFSDVKYELIYHPNMDGEYILPFYGCYVNTPQRYAYCSVCAISPEYIDATTDQRFN